MTDGKAAPDNKKTRTFLKDHGHGPDRLRAVLARIDWSRDDAFARGREALVLFVATVAELLVAEARARRQSPGACLNGLVAGGDPAELPVLALALQHMESQATITRLLPKNRAALAAALQTISAHVRLLRDGTLPASRLPELTPVDTDTLLPVLARQLRTEDKSSPASVALRLLKLSARGEEKTGVLLRRARLVQKLLDGKSPALDYRSFRSLPAALRQVLLFTPALNRFFLSPQAQAAARPPSPDFDPLYLEHSLTELGRGRLSHVEADTLFLGAQKSTNPSSAAFLSRIVETLANGSGGLTCDDDVRERLIAGSGTAELCLLACAAARSSRDVRRSLSQLSALPSQGVLSEALYHFSLIAWSDSFPHETPANLRAHADFPADRLAECTRQLMAFLQGEPARLSPATLFRHFTSWLATSASQSGGRRRERPDIDALLDQLSELFLQQGARLTAEIDGNDLHALFTAGGRGAELAHVLAGTLRRHNTSRWQHGFFTRIADINTDAALALINRNPDAQELEILRQVPVIPESTPQQDGNATA